MLNDQPRMPRDGACGHARAVRELGAAHCIAPIVDEAPLVELNPKEALEVTLKCIAAEGVEPRRSVKAKDLEATPLTEVR